MQLAANDFGQRRNLWWGSREEFLEFLSDYSPNSGAQAISFDSV